MGLRDILWPFEKKFTDIPGAREAGLACLLGGPGMGALSIIVKGTPKYAFQTSIYSGFVIFWVTFIATRTQYTMAKAAQDQFIQAYKAGKVD